MTYTEQIQAIETALAATDRASGELLGGGPTGKAKAAEAGRWLAESDRLRDELKTVYRERRAAGMSPSSPNPHQTYR